MKLPLKERALWPVAILALIVVLVVLAVLQYRWTQELNDAARDRMRANLQSSMLGLRDDFGRELTALSLALQADSRPQDLHATAYTYAQRLDAWKRTSAHADLLGKVYLWQDAAGPRPRLLGLDLEQHSFEPVPWPSELADIERPIRTFSADVAELRAPAHPEGGRGRNFLFRFPGRAGMPQLPWTIDESAPALIHAMFRQSGKGNAPTVDWVFIELNTAAIEQQIFPELAQRYFGDSAGLVYDVAVLDRTSDNHVLYSSNPKFGNGPHIPTDGRINLFGPPLGAAGGANRPVTFVRPELAGPAGPQPGPRQWQGFFVHAGGLRIEPFRLSPHPGTWELIVRHRKGSLEAAIAALRYRHLAISFGVLLVLAVTLAMIIVATRRAQRLAQLQMDFVAGVSHELRTPLAVISSAADNIADGIIQDRAKLARYGAVIRKQSCQLTQLVEQLLLFAATRRERIEYTLAPVAPSEILQAALSDSAELVRAAGFTVEQQIAPDLPLVSVDLPAVSHCLQNLIANAVKYGGETRWIGVRAYFAEGKRGREVRIEVRDRGMGIAPADLPRIFDPFYRSPAVVGAQIHGTGLGLALARGVAAAMNGELTVESESGKGSTFTLALPAAVAPEGAPAEQGIGAAAESRNT